MKKSILLICSLFLLVSSLCFVSSCTTSKRELARVASPDGKSTATLSTKVKRAIPLPGPEPPRVKARWAKLTVSKDGKTIYDTRFEKYGVYQSGDSAFDLSWSPDSSAIAYRMLNTLRIIKLDGNTTTFDIVKDNALVSSIKWLNGKELLVVSKGIDEPLGMYDYPVHYHGFLAKSTYVKVSKIDLDSGVVERFKQHVNRPGFLYSSISHVNHEVSPHSSRVAFSDGANIKVYDDIKGKIIAQAPIGGAVEGIWWSDDNTVIVGQGLLSEPQSRFSEFDVVNGTITDKTDALVALWKSSRPRADWLRKVTE